MITNLRNLALLMLAAGMSLGVFATTLLADRNPPPRPKLEQRIEERVKLYREMYNLDDGRTEEVRRELVRHQRELLDLLFRLRRENSDAFGDLVDGTENRIREIIER